MIAKIIIFGLLAASALAAPIVDNDDDDIPTYTEKVTPEKPTQAPKFGAKKVHAPPRKSPENYRHPEIEQSYAPPPHAPLGPKATLKTSRPLRDSSRPVRRGVKIPRRTETLSNDLSPGTDYDVPAPVFVPAQELGVEYDSDAPSSHDDYGLVDDYEPRRVHRGPVEAPRAGAYKAPARELRRSHGVDVPSDYGSAVGNAPQIRYAPAPERFSSAAAQVNDVPDYGYTGNSYEDKPQPYIFGYELKDENGSTQSRKEEGDDFGNKRGSYGYTDGYGIYRQVEYVADAHGFRAVVRTNEPGTESQDPADVRMQSEADKY